MPERLQHVYEKADRESLGALERGLAEALAQADADPAIYLASADPYFDDRLGRPALAKQGLLSRDRMVFEACEREGRDRDG